MRSFIGLFLVASQVLRLAFARRVSSQEDLKTEDELTKKACTKTGGCCVLSSNGFCGNSAKTCHTCTCKATSCPKPKRKKTDYSKVESKIDTEGTESGSICQKKAVDENGYDCCVISSSGICGEGGASCGCTCAAESCKKPTAKLTDYSKVESKIDTEGTKSGGICKKKAVGENGYDCCVISSSGICGEGGASCGCTCAAESCKKPTVKLADYSKVESKIDTEGTNSGGICKKKAVGENGYDCCVISSSRICGQGGASCGCTCAAESCKKPTVKLADYSNVESRIDTEGTESGGICKKKAVGENGFECCALTSTGICGQAGGLSCGCTCAAESCKKPTAK